jgi:hypothetical protein
MYNLEIYYIGKFYIHQKYSAINMMGEDNKISIDWGHIPSPHF